MRSRININAGMLSNAAALACNLLLAYLAYFLCRVEFVLENWSTFQNTLFQNTWTDLIKGCWMFDTSAILYTNSLYALLMLMPLAIAHKRTWRGVAKWVFIVTNSICIAANVIDSVYFQYTGRRTTMSVLNEFSNEGNIASIFLTEILRHWYLTLFVAALVFLLYILYFTPTGKISMKGLQHKCLFYACTLVCLALYVLLSICGMRGGATTAVRPITISNANQYVNHPQEAAVILNTPFSIIRTMGKKPFVVPQYFTDDELDALYSPEHNTDRTGKNGDSIGQKEWKNVVVLIVESFGREYIGAYNELLEDGNYKGYTPFMDSLYRHSLSFDYTFANGRKSIDGMPSILSTP